MTVRLARYDFLLVLYRDLGCKWNRKPLKQKCNSQKNKLERCEVLINRHYR